MLVDAVMYYIPLWVNINTFDKFLVRPIDFGKTNWLEMVKSFTFGKSDMTLFTVLGGHIQPSQQTTISLNHKDLVLGESSAFYPRLPVTCTQLHSSTVIPDFSDSLLNFPFSALSFLLGLYPPRNQTLTTSYAGVFSAPYDIQQVCFILVFDGSLRMV